MPAKVRNPFLGPEINFAIFQLNQLLESQLDVSRNLNGYNTALYCDPPALKKRITSKPVADCYDAIRSKRSYKTAIPHPETCALILQDSGKHFDPAVTAVFSKIEDRFREVWNQMSTVPEQLGTD
jgi:putative two-component system response regulator